MRQHWSLHKFWPIKLQLQLFIATSEILDKFHCYYWDFCMGNETGMVLTHCISIGFFSKSELCNNCGFHSVGHMLQSMSDNNTVQ